MNNAYTFDTKTETSETTIVTVTATGHNPAPGEPTMTIVFNNGDEIRGVPLGFVATSEMLCGNGDVMYATNAASTIKNFLFYIELWLATHFCDRFPDLLTNEDEERCVYAPTAIDNEIAARYWGALWANVSVIDTSGEEPIPFMLLKDLTFYEFKHIKEMMVSWGASLVVQMTPEFLHENLERTDVPIPNDITHYIPGYRPEDIKAKADLDFLTAEIAKLEAMTDLDERARLANALRDARRREDA